MSFGLPSDIVATLREKYQKGSKVTLIEMAPDIHRLPSGTKGRLDFIDDAGHFHVNWETGSTLSLIPGADNFQIEPIVFREIRYYMPLTVDRYRREFLGGDLDGPESMYDHEVIANLHHIQAALEKENSQYGEEGQMEFYDEDDNLKKKVKSCVFNIDNRRGKPWGVACCLVCDDLSEDEERSLRDFIEGQASDGFGEGFEQRAILNNCRDEIYVHFWQQENWFLKREDEF